MRQPASQHVMTLKLPSACGMNDDGSVQCGVSWFCRSASPTLHGPSIVPIHIAELVVMPHSYYNHVWSLCQHVLALRSPLWSSGQSSWLQIRGPGFDSRHYQIF
jgi:hypothetical protein